MSDSFDSPHSPATNPGAGQTSPQFLPRIGTVFAGYRIDAVLGRGGMSVVYRADNVRLGNKIALKVLAPELSENEAFRERFVRESKVAASINHPNIIPIYDAGDQGGLLYIVMRYIEGSDLQALLRRDGPLELGRAVNLIAQAGSALQSAHERGLIHRDIKPGNILVERIGGGEVLEHVYLADFGLTKHTLSNSGLTQTGQFLGTVDYVAPEQIKGEAVDRRSDVYSLGCVLYECLTGVVPFLRDTDAGAMYAHLQDEHTPVTSLRFDLPPTIDRIVDRALAKEPADRYPTCAEMVADLRQLAEQSREQQAPNGAAVAGPTSPAAVSATAVDLGGTPPAGGVAGNAGPVGPRSPSEPHRAGADASASRSWTRRPLLAGLVVLAVIAGAIVLAVALSSGGTSAQPTTPRSSGPTSTPRPHTIRTDVRGGLFTRWGCTIDTTDSTTAAGVPGSQTLPKPVESAACTTTGQRPISLRVIRYSTKADMRKAFQILSAAAATSMVAIGKPLIHEPADVAQSCSSFHSVGPWLNGNETYGVALCAQNLATSNNYVVWTNSGDPTDPVPNTPDYIIIATGDGGAPGQLFGFWNGSGKKQIGAA
ncbi:MAG: protein kinase domain-containing protein [Mycobacteriaceae bacterium]